MAGIATKELKRERRRMWRRKRKSADICSII
jgi:hypothetical protein